LKIRARNITLVRSQAHQLRIDDSGGFADDQFNWQDRPGWGGDTVHFAFQDLQHLDRHGFNRLMDGRQGWLEQAGDLNIVKASDPDVVRNAFAPGCQLPDHLGGDDITGGKNAIHLGICIQGFGDRGFILLAVEGSFLCLIDCKMAAGGFTDLEETTAALVGVLPDRTAA
jgi:hypothetical protein